MAVKSKYVEVEYSCSPEGLLDMLRSSFVRKFKGDVIRFAVEGKRGKKLLIHASVKQ